MSVCVCVCVCVYVCVCVCVWCNSLLRAEQGEATKVRVGYMFVEVQFRFEAHKQCILYTLASAVASHAHLLHNYRSWGGAALY